MMFSFNLRRFRSFFGRKRSQKFTESKANSLQKCSFLTNFFPTKSHLIFRTTNAPKRPRLIGKNILSYFRFILHHLGTFFGRKKIVKKWLFFAKNGHFGKGLAFLFASLKALDFSNKKCSKKP